MGACLLRLFMEEGGRGKERKRKERGDEERIGNLTGKFISRDNTIPLFFICEVKKIFKSSEERKEKDRTGPT